jgi:hypothetical protein
MTNGLDFEWHRQPFCFCHLKKPEFQNVTIEIRTILSGFQVMVPIGKPNSKKYGFQIIGIQMFGIQMITVDSFLQPALKTNCI